MQICLRCVVIESISRVRITFTPQCTVLSASPPSFFFAVLCLSIHSVFYLWLHFYIFIFLLASVMAGSCREWNVHIPVSALLPPAASLNILNKLQLRSWFKLDQRKHMDLHNNKCCHFSTFSF